MSETPQNEKTPQEEKKRGPGRPKGKPNGKYAWVEEEILVKVVGPKIEHTVNRRNPGSYRELREGMIEDWNCTASLNQLRDWIKALGYQLERVSHLVPRETRRLTRTGDQDVASAPLPYQGSPSPPPSPGGGESDLPSMTGRRPSPIPGVGGIIR